MERRTSLLGSSSKSIHIFLLRAWTLGTALMRLRSASCLHREVTCAIGSAAFSRSGLLHMPAGERMNGRPY